MRVLFVEDDPFTRSIIGDGLTEAGFETQTARTVSDALEAVVSFDPHVVVTDLDLGPVGTPSGADLLARLAEQRPWVGGIVLSIHRDVRLALGDNHGLPPGVRHIVKSDVQSMDQLVEAIRNCLESEPISRKARSGPEPDYFVVSKSQAGVLRLMAEGLSNEAIARHRGIALRSAESLIQRTFQSLGLTDQPDINPRVVAVRMWQAGLIGTKDSGRPDIGDQAES